MLGPSHTKVRSMVPGKWLFSRALQKRQPLYLVIVSTQRRENNIREVHKKGYQRFQQEGVMLLAPSQEGMLTKCFIQGQFLQQGDALSNSKHLSGLINLRNTPRCKQLVIRNIAILRGERQWDRRLRDGLLECISCVSQGSWSILPLSPFITGVQSKSLTALQRFNFMATVNESMGFSSPGMDLLSFKCLGIKFDIAHAKCSNHVTLRSNI